MSKKDILPTSKNPIQTQGAYSDRRCAPTNEKKEQTEMKWIKELTMNRVTGILVRYLPG
jgi:hypothetical protein